MARQGQLEVYQTCVEPYLDDIREWYQTMNMQQIADRLGLSKSTLYKYRKEHKGLADALTAGKNDLIIECRCSIKKRAMGYDWTEVKQEKVFDEESNQMVVVKETTTTKHVPPDLGSIHLLLKNLDPDWHDADMTTIKQREKELNIKQQKADAADW